MIIKQTTNNKQQGKYHRKMTKIYEIVNCDLRFMDDSNNIRYYSMFYDNIRCSMTIFYTSRYSMLNADDCNGDGDGSCQIPSFMVM